MPEASQLPQLDAGYQSHHPHQPLGSTSPVPGRCSAMVFIPRQTAPHSLTPGTLPSYFCSTALFYTIKTVSIKILGQKSVQNKISSMRYKYLASQISHLPALNTVNLTRIFHLFADKYCAGLITVTDGCLENMENTSGI